MRLSKEDIERHRCWLEKPHEPAEVESYVKDVADKMRPGSPLDKDFFTQAGIEFLRNAWVGAKFALATRADQIALVPAAERFPDIRIFYESHVENWEVTEAGLPGRLRGVEKKEAEKLCAEGGAYARSSSVSAETMYANAIPDALRSATKNKIDANYIHPVYLLIYLNVDIGVTDSRNITIEGKDLETSMADATSGGKDSFARISALFEDRVYHLWQDGNRAEG